MIRVRRLGRIGRRPGNATLARRARSMLRAMRLDRELSILVCDDSFIRALNRRYRHRNRATDVLSFGQIGDRGAPSGPRIRPTLGDVVISLTTARRNAGNWNEPFDAHVTRLLAHGILHLCGYDHATVREARQMGALTERLIRAASRRRTRA